MFFRDIEYVLISDLNIPGMYSNIPEQNSLGKMWHFLEINPALPETELVHLNYQNDMLR